MLSYLVQTWKGPCSIVASALDHIARLWCCVPTDSFYAAMILVFLTETSLKWIETIDFHSGYECHVVSSPRSWLDFQAYLSQLALVTP